MRDLVPVVLASWTLATVALFWWRPGRDAALISWVAGWALLPTGAYPASAFFTPVGSGGTIHALAVPGALPWNKALAIGLGCLIGVVLFDWAALRRLRPHWLDAPMFGWCLVPIASALANGVPLASGLSQSRYLALAWGVPYGLGRLYLGSDAGLRRLGLALVLAGLVYVPLGLLEFALGPFLYTTAYGSHPYQLEGAARLVGYRPLVFLEHGNQLGIWVACASVAAAWLARSGHLPALGGVPGWAASALLAASCLLFQSHTAILLMLAGLAPLAASLVLVPPGQGRGRGRGWGRAMPPGAYAAMASVALVLATAGATAALAAEDGGWSGLRGRVREVFRGMGKGSFTWRLARSEENMARVAERPVLGWSRPDWSAAEGGTFVNPVNIGFWLSAMGMFGAVGLACSTAVLLLPIEEALRKLPASAWLGGSAVAMTAALLAIVAFDSLLNGLLLPPLLAGAGDPFLVGVGAGREGAEALIRLTQRPGGEGERWSPPPGRGSG